jgi:hypothetical protein
LHPGLSRSVFWFAIVLINLHPFHVSAQSDGPDSPAWSYSNTGNNHTILIMNNIPILVNGSPVDSGDYIGVFFDSLGILACGGYVRWENAVTAVTAWGSDAGNDGFKVGEEFNWRIWRKSENIEYSAIATYNGDDFVNTGEYVVNGLSGLETLIAYSKQDIELPQGWSYFSTFINPVYPSVDSVFRNISGMVNIMKDETGKLYIPEVIDQIDALTAAKGYQVNMKKFTVLTVIGTDIKPALVQLFFSSQVNIAGYIRKNPASFDSLFSGIAGKISYIKDSWGNMVVPEYNINTLSNLAPGRGYKIKTSDTVTFHYLSNDTAVPLADTGFVPVADHFYLNKNTGNNMILIIPFTAWIDEPEPGDEIGAFDKYGHLVGSAVCENKNIAMIIWGNDDLTLETDGMITGDKFTLLYWHSSDTIDSIEVTRWKRGDDIYRTDSFSVADSIKIRKITNPQQLDFHLIMNPNNQEIEFSFFIPVSSYVSLSGYTSDGKWLGWFISDNFQSGSYSFHFSIINLMSAIYFFRIQINEHVIIKKAAVIKNIRQ